MEGDTAEELFTQCINDWFLTQEIREPSRKHNIPDLILTNTPSIIDNINIEAPLASSNHNIINFIMRCSSPQNTCNKTLIPDYQKANFNKMREEADKINWLSTFDSNLMTQ